MFRRKMIFLALAFFSLSSPCYTQSSTHYSYIVSSEEAPSRESGYRIIIEYRLGINPHGDFFKYSFQDVNVKVLMVSAKYNSKKIIFSKNFDGFSSNELSSLVPPLHDNGYLFIFNLLPSGRLFFIENDLYFTLFDGNSVCLLRYHVEKNIFMELKNFSKLEKDFLKTLHSTSFRADDVYWCFCLIKFASFFQSTYFFDISSPRLLFSDNLYKEWVKSKSYK